jgi:hypothetical protein
LGRRPNLGVDHPQRLAEADCSYPAAQEDFLMARDPFRRNYSSRNISDVSRDFVAPGDDPFRVETPPIDPERVRRERAPLLLMPMRLEYRLVRRSAPERVRVDGADVERIRDLRRSGAFRDPNRLRTEVDPARARARTEFESGDLSLERERELWFRWYPESDFARAGVTPADADEEAALKAFLDATRGAPWWKTSSSGHAAAWQTFVRRVGPARAVHLARGGGSTENWAKATGRITALPRYVSIFAITGSQVERLAQGRDIPPNAGDGHSDVAYTPDAVEPGSWLTEFDTAVELGMGVKVTDEETIRTALEADWIVAVGLHEDDARDEVTALVRDAVANGEIAALRQDSPTNNAPGARTQKRSFRDEPERFLVAATADERGAFDDDRERSADILADALGLERSELRRVVNGADMSFEDSRAMMRALGPAILDGSLDGATTLKGIDENDLVEVLATTVAARGRLPSIRLGNNAYGVVTVMRGEFDPAETAGFSAQERDVFSFLSTYSRLSQSALARRAQQRTPRLTPDASDPAGALKALLQNARVSGRIEISKDGESETEALGCPYVSGWEQSRRPTDYLAALRTQPLDDLPDPTEEDRTWPLLYRLLRLSLILNAIWTIERIPPERRTGIGEIPSLSDFEHLDSERRRRVIGLYEEVAAQSGASSRIVPTGAEGFRMPVDVLRVVHQRMKAFDEALVHLEEVAARPEGDAELETLMLEVFDLFQHRIDAWAVGVAAARLGKVREAGQTELRAGWWSLLGPLREPDQTVPSDGYVQAPSLQQATTAAILRSAAHRHAGNGAFEVDLSSRRLRRGVAMLDFIEAGSTLSAAVGLRAERLLRKNRDRGDLVPQLRRQFPIRNKAPPETETEVSPRPATAGEPKLDGLALLDAQANQLLSDVQAIRPQLADDLDALSDVVMAEAVHQQAQGSVEAANAWLQVLSGDPAPGRPSFAATNRPGQTSTHRLMLMLDAAEPPDSPEAQFREIAEPTLAALAVEAAPVFGDLTVEVRAIRAAESDARARRSFALESDLGMAPIDLMIGGASELQVRARAEFQRLRRVDDELANALAPEGQSAEAGNQPLRRPEEDFELQVHTGSGEGSTAKAMERLRGLRQVVASGRPLDAGDLNAAAPAAEGDLSESEATEISNAAAATVQQRVDHLKDALAALETKLDAALPPLRNAVGWARKASTGNDATDRKAAIQEVERARRDLVHLLPRLAEAGEPSVLRRIPSAVELIADDDRLDAIRRAHERLRKKIQALGAHGAPARQSTLSCAREQLRVRIEALRGVLDGEALPILPPVSRRPATMPSLESSQDVETLLAPWIPVREDAREARDALSGLAAIRGFQTTQETTVAPGEDDDPRGEAEAPRARLYGLVLAKEQTTQGAAPVAGATLGEWVESRASTRQTAAMAVNYNAPRAEAPNAMLLCTPPGPSDSDWTEEDAVGYVMEALDWMRARSLTTEQKLTPVALFPKSNQVPPKQSDGEARPRLPTGRLLIDVLSGDPSASGLFVPADDLADRVGIGPVGTGLNTAGGFGPSEE